MSKLRLLTLVGLLAAALAPLSGCGSECAEGTAEQDGECVAAAEGCAEGTRFEDGECLLDTTGCAEGTMFDDGQCVPAAETCEGDTLFDEGSQRCVADTDIICGEGTEVGDDGWCVPSQQACVAPASLDDEGRCVISAATCGPGTELVADTNECVLADAACDEGLALDGETHNCVPTDEICETGTKFDADSGLCLNDSCREGDVLVDGVCMTPAEELAGEADLDEEGENNDPALGGSPAQLATPQVGDDLYAFTGAIAEPSDIDGDGSVDQDVDVFEFEAEVGDWFQIAVQPLNHEPLAFVVEGPDEFVRNSPVHHAAGAARTIVAPAEGIYRVKVLPARTLRDGAQTSPVGGEQWAYVGSLETLEAPQPTEVDLTQDDAELSGELTGLTDNLFELSGHQASEMLRFDVVEAPAGAEGVLQLWSGPLMLESTTPISKGSVLEMEAVDASTRVLIDWTSMEGDAVDFEIAASISGSENTLTLAPGDSRSFPVTAGAGNDILAVHQNSEGEPLSVQIDDVFGELATNAELEPGVEFTAPVEVPGEHTVTFTNSTEQALDATLIAKEASAMKLGELQEDELRTAPAFDIYDEDQVEIEFSLDAGSVVRFGQTNEQGNSFAYRIVDPDGVEVASESNFFTTDGVSDPAEYQYVHSESGGTYTFEVTGDDTATDTVMTFENLGSVATLWPAVNAGESMTHSETKPLAKGEMRFFRFDSVEAGRLLAEAHTPNHEDVDLFLYESGFDDAPTASEIPIDEQLTDEVEESTTYWLLVHAWAPLPSFELELALNPQLPEDDDYYVSAPELHVPDNNLDGVTDTLTAEECTAIDRVAVYVDIEHQYNRELRVTLTSPNGTKVRLRNSDHSNDSDLIGWYPYELNVTENLNVLRDEAGGGKWSLNVVDDESGTANTEGGTFHEWGLHLECQ